MKKQKESTKHLLEIGDFIIDVTELGVKPTMPLHPKLINITMVKDKIFRLAQKKNKGKALFYTLDALTFIYDWKLKLFLQILDAEYSKEFKKQRLSLSVKENDEIKDLIWSVRPKINRVPVPYNLPDEGDMYSRVHLGFGGPVDRETGLSIFD